MAITFDGLALQNPELFQKDWGVQLNETKLYSGNTSIQASIKTRLSVIFKCYTETYSYISTLKEKIGLPATLNIDGTEYANSFITSFKEEEWASGKYNYEVGFVQDTSGNTIMVSQDSIAQDNTEATTWDSPLLSLKSNLNRIRNQIVGITGEAWGTVNQCVKKAHLITANTVQYKDNLGTDIIHAHDAEASTTSGSYVKLKTITLTETPDSTLKVYFEVRTSIQGQAKVCRNGVIIGTEWTITNTNYESRTESIAGWGNGDTLELWVRSDFQTIFVKNFRILGTVGNDNLVNS